MKTGIELISEEREKQILKHGFTGQHHALHPELYAENQLIEASVKIGAPVPYNQAPKGWDVKWFANLCERPYKERLVIAGALIAAELDRRNSDN